MNKNLYSTAMDKVTMSDECLGEILDNIDEVPEETAKPKKIRYIQILTAAVVFIFGSVTVAAEVGGFEWIKSFFNDEEVIQSVYDLVTEIDDFQCESNYNVKISPIGMLGDETDLYAVFHIDNMPNNLKGEFLDFYVTSDHQNRLRDSEKGYGSSFGTKFDSEKNNLIIQTSSSQKVFEDGDNIKMVLNYYEYYDKNNIHTEKLSLSNLAEINFTAKLGNYNSLNINYKEYMPDFIPKRDYDFIFDELTVTPLSLTTIGRSSMYATALISDGFTVVLSDGTELLLRSGFSCASYRDKVNAASSMEEIMNVSSYSTVVNFEEPIDPNSVTEIYLGNMLIYRK